MLRPRRGRCRGGAGTHVLPPGLVTGASAPSSTNGETVAVVVVTHDLEVAAMARRRVAVRDGLVESDDSDEPAGVPS